MENLIISIVGVLFGGGIATLLKIKPTNKKMIAETKNIEIGSLRDAIKTLQEQNSITIEQLTERVNHLQKELDAVRQKIERYNLVLHKAYECKIPTSECPVLRSYFLINNCQYDEND